MWYAISVAFLATNVASFFAGRKHGQQVVLKALAEYHLALAIGSGVKQAFVNFIQEFKSKF